MTSLVCVPGARAAERRTGTAGRLSETLLEHSYAGQLPSQRTCRDVPCERGNGFIPSRARARAQHELWDVVDRHNFGSLLKEELMIWHRLPPRDLVYGWPTTS